MRLTELGRVKLHFGPCKRCGAGYHAFLSSELGLCGDCVEEWAFGIKRKGVDEPKNRSQESS